jgi:hypothetical protein
MELKESYEFLNRLRDVYRLTVAPQNQLDPEQLAVPAEVLGYRKCEDGTAEKKLAAEFRKHATRVARKLYALIDAMEEC